MRKVVPFTNQYHPLAKESHDLFPDIERVDVSQSNFEYQKLLEKLWGEKESFILIEHDIEVTELAIKEAEECDCLWGVSPYEGPGLGTLYKALGFVRFRQELMEREPDAMGQVAAFKTRKDIQPGHWRGIDAELYGVFAARGYEPCIHSPVFQHHVYLGQCACGMEHEAFPVDQEGRYKP